MSNFKGTYVTRRQMDDLRNQEIYKAQKSAQDRFDRNRERFIARNPNAVSNFERNAILGRAQRLEDDEALRRHEIAKIKAQGEADRDKEREHAQGLIGQGSKAAKFNADAAKYGADIQKEIAIKNAETNQAINFNKTESDERIANTRVQSEAEQARLQREHEQKLAETKAEVDKSVAATNAGAKVDAAKITAEMRRLADNTKLDNAKMKEFRAWQATLNDPMKTAGMDPDELKAVKTMDAAGQLAYWLKKTGQLEGEPTPTPSPAPKPVNLDDFAD